MSDPIERFEKALGRCDGGIIGAALAPVRAAWPAVKAMLPTPAAGIKRDYEHKIRSAPIPEHYLHWGPGGNDYHTFRGPTAEADCRAFVAGKNAKAEYRKQTEAALGENFDYRYPAGSVCFVMPDGSLIPSKVMRVVEEARRTVMHGLALSDLKAAVRDLDAAGKP